MKRFALVSVLAMALLAVAPAAESHCQIPCGIFDDEMRVQLIEEHITTVEKSMKEIVAIEGAKDPNHNQLVRWVVNKEQHAQEIQDIVTAYFMAQRIKWPEDMNDERATKAYLHELALLHQIQVHAMKAKQSTDLGQIERLRELVQKFRKAYFGEEGTHEH